MKSRMGKVVCCGLALATVHLTTAFGATFMGLGRLPGATECSVNDVSADGTVVVGFCEFDSSTEPFRWTAATGMVSLGTLAGHPFALAESVSADGSVVVGRAASPVSGFPWQNSEAFRWTEATGMVGLGYLPGGGSVSEATGVSADGSVVVGTSDSSLLFQEAFRWTEATGMVGLGTLTGDNSSIAGSISGNGNVVVGTSRDGVDDQAFRWTEATGMVGLGYLPGGPGFQPFYTAEAASADGAVVVGRGGQPTEREAFRWTEATGMVGLGDLPGGSEGSQAFDVSADGSVVVGSGDWSTGGGWKAFIWDATNGMRNLRDVLIAEGLDLTGWSLEMADGISADGKTIAGDGDNGEPYIATLDTSPNPCAGFVACFQDVPESYWAYSFIETIAELGITSGCDATHYCPTDPVDRAQMAVFVERGMRGGGYDPGPGVGNIFLDVPPGYWAGGWIEQLSMDGITGGCDATHYCPSQLTTRAEMAVFLLRAKYGMDYAPPTPVGVFGDVAVTYWAAGWIEQLAAEGITSGCGGGNYCPADPVNRDQMAVFLVNTFQLQ